MINKKLIDDFYDKFSDLYKNRIDICVESIVKAHNEHEKIAIVTGCQFRF